MSAVEKTMNRIPMEKFETGSVRDQGEGKGSYELISPYAIDRLAKRLEYGKDHYGVRNWEKGQPFGRVLQSTLRHLNQYLMGKTNEDHLGAAFTNIMFLIHFEEMIKQGKLPDSLNDLPKYEH